jgi:hypothetical protein
MNKEEAKKLSDRIAALVKDLENVEYKLKCVKSIVNNLSFKVTYKNEQGNLGETTVYASSETCGKIRQLLIEQYEQLVKEYSERLEGIQVYNFNNLTK